MQHKLFIQSQLKYIIYLVNKIEQHTHLQPFAEKRKRQGNSRKAMCEYNLYNYLYRL